MRACVNDSAIQNAESYALAITTSTSASVQVAPGLYRVFLAGMDPTVSVALRTGPSSLSGVSFPNAGSPAICAVFPGNAVERVRVLPGADFVWALSLGGSGTLYLVPLVML